MLRLPLMALCALTLLACNKGETPDDPAPKPAAEKAEQPAVDPAARAAEKAPTPAAEEMEGGDDRPGEIGCNDCLARVETAGIKLDTARLDNKGDTPTAARLDLTVRGRTVKLPVPHSNLGKADLALDDSLDGLPAPKECDTWSGAKATLEVDYTTAAGEKETRLKAMPIEVAGCK